MHRSARLALFAAVTALFQSHWVDDVGSGESDAAGIAVSAIATVTLVIGFLSRGSRLGRLVYRLGLLFVVWVSFADLIGMRPDGTLTTDLRTYWSTEFGLPLTITVATTLGSALALLAPVRASSERLDQLQIGTKKAPFYRGRLRSDPPGCTQNGCSGSWPSQTTGRLDAPLRVQCGGSPSWWHSGEPIKIHPPQLGRSTEQPASSQVSADVSKSAPQAPTRGHHDRAGAPAGRLTSVAVRGVTPRGSRRAIERTA